MIADAKRSTDFRATDPTMKILFVTGTLAEPALREVVRDLGPRIGFEAEVAALPISVAALMTPKWVARHLRVPEGIDRVILPGHCRGDLSSLEIPEGVSIEVGPEDLRDLPRFFGVDRAKLEDYGKFDIEILAEINHAPRLTLDELVAAAENYRVSGADLIDLGCVPGQRWESIGKAVTLLKREGFRLSVDTFDPDEVRHAVDAGAELVLSVNASNRAYAESWEVEVVAIPDVPGSLIGLAETIAYLGERNIPFRIDPVLDPIGYGFAASLGRFLEARRLFPETEIMMGIGNLTELTDVDSAGVNTVLIGFCQELRIRSVLTTEVINWARSSVREIDLARRLMHHAVTLRRLPKHVEPRLVTLRDSKVSRYGPEILAQVASRIKDRNWRIFAEDGKIIAMNGSKQITNVDPFLVFEEMEVDEPSHAFYLGYEMMKAQTALTLSKNYRQDQALDWGYLTVAEVSHRERKARLKAEEST